MSTMKEKVEAYGIKKVIDYLDSNPEENMPKVFDWLSKLDLDNQYAGAFKLGKSAVNDPASIWHSFLMSLFTDIDPDVRKTFFENFLVNSVLIGGRRKREIEKEYDCNVPWTLLMDPTSACNLHCTGCWAAEYGNQLSLSLSQLDDIIRQGKELGMYMYIYTGGEPLVRKDDIIQLCEKHSDCIFLSFTNGTLIDEAFADKMLQVKNFIPAISVEGFEAETDMRRGNGTYQKVVKAMEILKERKLPFGFSTCYHKHNTEVIGSEKYFDDMIARGCKFGWIFTYMPVGLNAIPDLMATAQQREFMYHQIRKFRQTKPIFTMDFWNDGEYVNGCIAGGRCYLHINANGDVDPCAFIHYSDSNIKEKTLLEALCSPFFMQYRKHQPFHENRLRVCPLLDNPGALAEMVHASGAHSTDLENPEDIDVLSEKCRSCAEQWKPVADKLWYH
ncbi:radical SAM protein [Clostridium aminobutyricum]|uniref:Radical SAM protein n=1 Tax=Clostridium aminobutyricum TaxID=33953 RepID=A0A939IJ61_CLOAM|nr:radical SAM protein [Clostridium aminobutyricum]MBN7773234.1 radical SAM protein [Clostridium aminobutyricum]